MHTKACFLMIPYICFSSMLLRPKVSEILGKVWPCVINSILSPLPSSLLSKLEIIVFARKMVSLPLILSGYWLSMFPSPSYSVFRSYRRIRPGSCLSACTPRTYQLKAWRSEQNRTGLVLNPRLKSIFQRFFGGMAGLAEEQPFHVLETGSWQGESASWIAEHVLKHPESILVCLDTWNGSPPPENSGYDMAAIEDRFLSNMARIPNGDRVVAFKGNSLESLANIAASRLDSRFDAVFLDGSHEMKDVLGGALLSFRMLKVGGVMIFDDYWMRGVAQATAAFEEALGDYLEVLHRDETHLVVLRAANERFARHGSERLLGDSSRLQKLTSQNPTA
ncbi:unnamed protein product [Ectocarpus sp. 4 AP-2014]